MSDIKIKLPLKITKATNKDITLTPDSDDRKVLCSIIIPIVDIVGVNGVFDFGAYDVSGTLEVAVKVKAIRSRKKRIKN